MTEKVRKLLKQQEKESPDNYSVCGIGAGNMTVIGYRDPCDDNAKHIIVAKNYQELVYGYRL